ncbi:chaoptin [Neocloeon triangulifer]|uniref:chaoptin n=1 Tax=Neocloeon triangulifer TaxID=2078957 RepID=UPI00286F03D3|nr:chaoptin [Neocloeon triangulifer]
MFIAVKIGYAMVVLCLLLMSWAILVKAGPVALNNGIVNYPMSLGAQQDASDAVQYPPCAFNPLCTCSKTVPDLGIVSCRDVPLARVPLSLNSSRVFILRLENNGLRWIEPQLLQNTGLYRLQISDNPLPEMPDDSLQGLERSLWELALQRNRLTSVPNRAIRYLRRLRLLDLTGNDIYELFPDSFRGLEESLETLILADNSISSLPPGAFSELSRLETLDMRGNALQNLDAAALPPRIQHLSLADNLLSSMPIAALKTGLRSLDLSKNRLTKVYPEEEDDEADLDPTVASGSAQGGRKNTNTINYPKISLDVLRLEYNFISELPEASFRAFTSVNFTFLDGNPINTIYDDAFKDARIRDLSMRDCGISSMPPNVFGGLEQSLHYLDLSSNNLSELPHGVLARLPNLRGLNLRDNRMKIEPSMFDHDYSGGLPSSANVRQSNRNADANKKSVHGNAQNLHHLDVSGREMDMYSSVPEMMLPWSGLRELSFGRFKGGKKLSSDDFTELSPDVEELNFINSGLTGIEPHAFRNARGVRRLDVSENSIKNIDNDAFVEIGHSLDELRMHRALKMDSIPHKAFMHLTGTKEMDLSANGLKNIPEGAFQTLKGLRRLRLHDNQIGRIPKGSFLSETHSYLEDVDFSFNSIDHVYVDTFKDLTSLREIHLDDNKIASLEPKSFTDLPRLRILDLQGNRLPELNTDTFQNLPELEELDISYNHLKQLNFAALDQVGTLASLRFNVSHNKLKELKPVNNLMVSNSNNNQQGNYHVNVKIMDMSFNNITEITGGFFRPIESALTYLMLSHNSMTNATREAFGNMPHLQWLDLSYNNLKEVDFDAFRHTRRLQVLYMQNNDLSEIPAESFHGLTDMRVVSFANNNLRQLPDGLLFAASNLERLDVSNNQLTRVPIGVFSSGSGRSLCELDLSGNQIAALQPTDAVNRFKSLTFLDLSDNRLTRLDDSTFLGMSQLSSLHLSHNNFDSFGLSSALAALDSSPRLVELSLAGLNLDTLPSLPPLPALRELDARENILPALPSDLAANLTGLRMLDVRHNSLNTLGQVGLGGGLILPQLRSLKIAHNPLGLITDACLATATRLGELDIRNLTQLTAIENGALSKMNHLRTLKIGTFNMARDFNIPRIVKHNIALKNLYIEVDSREKDLNDKMNGVFPTKLSAVYFSGNSLKSIGTSVLQGIRNPRLHIGIHNTSVEAIPKAFFNQLGRARNLTLDVRNNTLKSMANPNSGERPGAPKSVFLTSLKMSGNKWNCDCELGWVEVWQRKKRQFLCPDGDRYDCEYGAEDDLRNSQCENKQKNSLIEILKTDLECGWSSGSVPLAAQKAVVIIPAIALVIMSVLY